MVSYTPGDIYVGYVSSEENGLEKVSDRSLCSLHRLHIKIVHETIDRNTQRTSEDNKLCTKHDFFL